MRLKSVLLFTLLATLFLACRTTQELGISIDQPSSENTTKYEASVQKESEKNINLEELFWARRDSTKFNFTQTDVDFMAGMIGHHSQALIMSSLATPNNASRSVQTLAARIINAQKDEIAIMQRWLSDRNQTVPQVKIEGLNLIITPGSTPSLIFSEEAVIAGVDSTQMVEDHSIHDLDTIMHDHSGMPGILNDSQLQELADAKGLDFDRIFLRYMIQHHAGAITMVNDLIEVDGAVQDVQIGKLADDINVDQKTEIERMRLMLLQIIEAEGTE